MVCGALLVEDVVISVRRGGREIDRVTAPPFTGAGEAVVTYRKRRWPVRAGAIDLDGPTLDPEPAMAAPASPADPRSDSQSAIVGAEPDRRLLVDAPPGTGKTWAACARVAALIENGTPASKIWMISFTRTAVSEIRSRIAGFASPQDTASVRVSTLDAYAWALQSGFDAEATLSGSFEEGIAATLERVESDPDLQDYLARVQHLIVDEAQDIMGVRARLVAAIVSRLDPDAGVTVFADPAQAIYGFTGDEDGLGGDVSLLDLIPNGFERKALDEVRRTRCPRLRELFLKTRRRVLSRGDVADRAAVVREDIFRLAHEQSEPGDDGGVARGGSDRLILFRQRAEVLRAASYAQDRPYRLRMSGLPSPVHSWIAELFWDWTDRRMGVADFVARTTAAGWGETEAQARWSLLRELGGQADGSLDLHRLRRQLARSSPPLLVCAPEFGSEGPIVGTIHASKGREADHVSLWLPPADAEGEAGSDDEEVRVAFVGATRARLTLTVGNARPIYAGWEDGRVWRRTKSGLQVEVGRTGDLRPEGLVGGLAFTSAAEVEAAQARVLQSGALSLRARSRAELDYRFSLETVDGDRLALLSDTVKADLKAIAGRARRWPPPGQLNWLRSLGARTVALAPDDPILERLHEPWRTTGLMLAPLVTGFASGRLG